jgi:hypothetical protein
MTNKHRFLVLWALVVFCLAVFAPVASAQFAETTGQIKGTVKDSSGAVIVGAKVELAGTALVAAKTITTDSSGYYMFAQLPSGVYTFSVTAAGFQKHIQKDIILDIGKHLTFNIELTVGAVAIVVEVSSAAVQIDVTSSKSETTISDVLIDMTPKARGALNLLQWAPGARNEPASGGFQMDGASSSENQYTVEGQDTTNILFGTITVNPPFDFFKEVSVKSGGFEAQYGGAMGGLVNLTVKQGGSTWHGDGVLYLRHDALNAGPRHFIRRNPGVSLSSVPPRSSEPIQEYRSREDRDRILEPGFELGGPVWKDRLYLFTSYIPRLERNSRTVNITFPGVTGLRTFTMTDNTHYAVGRLDGRITNNLRAFAIWDYAYRRTEGTDRPAADDVGGAVNASAATDPGTRRPDRGQTLPNVLWRMGADWTPTTKLVVAGGYGKWFADSQDRGVPTGIRHIFQSSNVGLLGLNGATIPAANQNLLGFADIPSNNQTLFNSLSRTQANFDVSYVLHAMGTHTLKGGYSLNKLGNSIIQTTNSARVDLYWGEGVTQSGPFGASCIPIVAANLAAFSGPPNNLIAANACRGNFGYYDVVDFQTRGKVSSNNHGLYFQDGWSMGHGVTINAGIRFEQEGLPAFNGPGTGNPAALPVVAVPIKFGFSDKVAPRIGGAWDVFKNGKIKVYGSWGWFYDIMKYELPRGSFGGEYWHNCSFTLDTAAFNTIAPTVKPGNFTCNAGAAGVLPGTFLGEEDLRIPSNTATGIKDIVDPGLKPIRQTETIVGGEWAMTKNMSLELRYAHRRLRNAIEDAGILTNAGEVFLIVNPGEGIGQFPLRGDCAVPGPSPARDPRCDAVLGISTLPAMPKAKRDYDALEVRFNKRFTNNWFANASYTWSRLHGNYSGLASSDEDTAQRALGGGGRTDPNVSRNFDEQEITYNSFGKPEFGPLATDRPHTFKAFGGYQLKWKGMVTSFSANEQLFIGTPRGTRIIFADLDLPVYVYGRDTFADISLNPATGAWILNGLKKGLRTPVYYNTDFSLTHQFSLSKTNELLKLAINLDATNLFNIGRVITMKDRTDRSRVTDVVRFTDPTCNVPVGSPCASVSGLNRSAFFNGFDPIVAVNGTSIRLDTLYNHEVRNQTPRELRLMLKVLF